MITCVSKEDAPSLQLFNELLPLSCGDFWVKFCIAASGKKRKKYFIFFSFAFHAFLQTIIMQVGYQKRVNTARGGARLFAGTALKETLMFLCILTFCLLFESSLNKNTD